MLCVKEFTEEEKNPIISNHVKIKYLCFYIPLFYLWQRKNLTISNRVKIKNCFVFKIISPFFILTIFSGKLNKYIRSSDIAIAVR